MTATQKKLNHLHSLLGSVPSAGFIAVALRSEVYVLFKGDSLPCSFGLFRTADPDKLVPMLATWYNERPLVGSIYSLVEGNRVANFVVTNKVITIVTKPKQ